MRLACKLVLILLPQIALASGWEAEVWTNHAWRVFTNGSANLEYTKNVVQSNVVAAIAERTNLLDLATFSEPSQWFRGNRDYLLAAKQWVEDECTNFCDLGYVTNGTYNGYFSNNVSATTFPKWTPARLIDYVGAPANYFSHTPYRALTDSGTTNGWHYLDDMLNAMVWIEKAATLDNATSITIQYDPTAVSSNATESDFATVTLLYGNDGISCVSTGISGTNGTIGAEMGSPAARGTETTNLAFTAVSTGTVGAASFVVRGAGRVLYDWAWEFVEDSFTNDWYSTVSSPACSCGDTPIQYEWREYYDWYSDFDFDVYEATGIARTTTTGQYTYASNLGLACEVDVYHIGELVGESETNVIITAVVPTNGYITFNGVAENILGTCATDYFWTASASVVETANLSLTGTVDNAKGLPLSSWEHYAYYSSVPVPATGVYPGHDYSTPSPDISQAFTTIATAAGSDSDFNQVDRAFDIWCDSCTGILDNKNVTETVDQEVEWAYAGYGMSSVGDHVWGGNYQAEKMLVKYDVANGFTFRE